MSKNISLLENPIKSMKLPGIQARVFNFFERPSESKISVVYHVFILFLIVTSVALSVVSTVKYIEESINPYTIRYEAGLLILFIIDYGLRIFGSKCLQRHRGFLGTIKFLTDMYMIVDAFIIVSTLTTLLLHIKKSYFNLLRVLRFLQVFRILRLDRRRGDLQTMGIVVYQHRRELLTCYFMVFIILFTGTFGVYMFEKDVTEEGAITDMADGLYWAMITITSVGYGDLSPKTLPGKMISGVFALVGCAFFALPAGLLGSGFALQVSKIKNKRQFGKKRNPAALLIQTLWRVYAVKRGNDHLEATWYFMLPQLAQEDNLKETRRASCLDKVFRTSLNPLVLDQLSYEPPCTVVLTSEESDEECAPVSDGGKRKGIFNFDAAYLNYRKYTKRDILSPKEIPLCSPRIPHIGDRIRPFEKKAPVSLQIRTHFIIAVRFVVQLKYLSAVRKFKNFRYPYVSIQDVMERSVLNHCETLAYLSHIKNGVLHCRNDSEQVNNIRYLQRTTEDKISELDIFLRQQIDNIKEELKTQNKHIECLGDDILRQLKSIQREKYDNN